MLKRGKMTCEDHVKREVKKIFKHYGCWYFMPYMAGRGRVGIPDFIANVAGQFLAVETKFAARPATENQKNEIKDIKDTGGIAVIINEDGLDNLETLVRQLKGITDAE